MADLIKCSNCPRRCPAEAFVGRSGATVKRCQKCRDKDAKQKKRPDLVAKRNARQRERKYYTAHRAKKRTEDEAGYLAHNAAIMRAWVSRNKDHLSKWRTKNVAHRLTLGTSGRRAWA
jgi:hypothetical protein